MPLRKPIVSTNKTQCLMLLHVCVVRFSNIVIATGFGHAEQLTARRFSSALLAFFNRCTLICALFFQEQDKIVEIKAPINTP